ncbi:MAG TPA: protein-L-isoaspartate(D-aspartate) O-methyltransferase [Gammaproteobacteria bacterium]|mgnify:CR=1 FL=1|nr:protein-L-isoaspartate(D-aspartate) O-methyltransferase [Pseudomonadota bacterium]HAY47164.1 protein-L-isoaspartate(D-aspartate) O-methyltransferase [Gammaproteobacteria bacterium]
MNSTTQGIGMTSARTRKRLIAILSDAGIRSPIVLSAMEDVPRHLFVDEALATRAYENTALPIGHGQTISQPYIVALMCEQLLNAASSGPVLEIGTGCGYQAAVLSKLFKKVVSIERVGELCRQARDRLFTLKFHNVHCVHGDGFDGFAERAPYSGIIAAAASDDVPTVLLEQLAMGGRLVMPIDRGAKQSLIVIDHDQGGFTEREIETVKFVPRVSGVTR